jgi:hypothetical protein
MMLAFSRPLQHGSMKKFVLVTLATFGSMTLCKCGSLAN